MNEEEKNEKNKISQEYIFATIVIQIAKIGISGFTFYI